MNVAIYIFLVIIVFVTSYSIMIYNRLVDIKHTVSQAWSNIDILIKRITQTSRNLQAIYGV